MFIALRAGGLASAFIGFVALFATPSMAAEAAVPVDFSLPAVETVQAAPAPAAVQPATAQPFASQPAAVQPAVAAPAFIPAPQKRPLRDLVGAFVDYGNQDAEQDCLATAVYFEARGESLEGQLAVANVVLNRAASGRYPPTICDVVTQPAQFSFVRGGRFPSIDRSSDCWHKALAIADIARKNLAQEVAPNVLWYHANYVSPSWGRRLTRVAQIGTHIFYS